MNVLKSKRIWKELIHTVNMKQEEKPCIICGGEIADEWGHNPEPIKDYNEGRCCDTCNFTIVIPERIRLSFSA